MQGGHRGSRCVSSTNPTRRDRTFLVQENEHGIDDGIGESDGLKLMGEEVTAEQFAEVRAIDWARIDERFEFSEYRRFLRREVDLALGVFVIACGFEPR